MSARGYDTQCENLARYFLGDYAAEDHPQFVSGLAQAIQDTVENWLKSEMKRIGAEIRAGRSK